MGSVFLVCSLSFLRRVVKCCSVKLAQSMYVVESLSLACVESNRDWNEGGLRLHSVPRHLLCFRLKKAQQ